MVKPWTAEQERIINGSVFDKVYRLPLDSAVSLMDSTGATVDSLDINCPVRSSLDRILPGIFM